MVLPPITVQLPPLSDRSSDPEWVVPFAQHLEACGFDGIGIVEHSVMISDYRSRYPYAPDGRVELPADCDLPDPLDLLAFLAGHTSRLRLTTAVLVLPNHHPVVLAKRLATVDRLSAGRLRVAVGVGWMSEELQACGVDPRTRGRRVEEQIRAMRALWAAGPDGASFDGEFYAFTHAVSRPLPHQTPGVPILIGGHSPAAARRAGRLGDGFQPIGIGPDVLDERLATMRRAAKEAGREPGELQVILGHTTDRITVDRVESLVARGATGIVLRMTPHTDLTAACDELSACAERLGLA